MRDLNSLSALRLLSKPLSCYFIKQKYSDLWIFAHGTTGKSFSDVDVDNMMDIADFVVNEVDTVPSMSKLKSRRVWAKRKPRLPYKCTCVYTVWLHLCKLMYTIYFTCV